MATTAMKLTDQVTLYPNATISGKSGENIVDTGIDVSWPTGPARVYLHAREIAEAVRVSSHLPQVADVLKAVGWVTADDHASTVAELEQKAAAAADGARAAVAKALENVLPVSQTVAVVAAKPAAKTKPAAAKRKPAAKKKA